MELFQHMQKSKGSAHFRYFAIITDQFHSLLSNIGKIIKKLTHQKLNQFPEENECFYPNQFGFILNISSYK